MEDRKLEEISHANMRHGEGFEADANFKQVTANSKYYSIARKSSDCIKKWFQKNCPGKKVLDYCCSIGGVGLEMYEYGAADVTGIDISDVSIERAKKRVAPQLLDKKIRFLVMDAENTKFEDNTFDVIQESGALHHLDLERAYAELARILKPTGACLCHETMGHNMLIHLYRKLTPQVRTKWETEHILTKRSIEGARKYFNKVEILGNFHLVSICAVPFRGVPWLFNFFLSIFELADDLLLRLPFIKWQAWQAVFILSEPKK